MADLSAIRARLKDRQVKEGALGITEASICLDVSLLADLSALEAERARILAERPKADAGSLAGGTRFDETEVDGAIEAMRQEIRAASLRLVFTALPSKRYQDVVNRFDEPDDDDRYNFLAALMEACFKSVYCDGEKVDLTWQEIAAEMSPGEFDEIGVSVLRLNKRRQDIPFSLKPSKPTRSSAETPEPAAT